MNTRARTKRAKTQDEAQADHIMAEINTFRRRSDEIAQVSAGLLERDPAWSADGQEPVDSGAELTTTEQIHDAVDDLVEAVEFPTYLAYLTFRNMENVRIRLELVGGWETMGTERPTVIGVVHRAYLETYKPRGGWIDPRELKGQDFESVDWLIRNVPAVRDLVFAKNGE